jgi:hypothetical protein
MNTSIENHQTNFDQATENIKRNLERYGRSLHIKKFRNPAFTFVEID